MTHKPPTIEALNTMAKATNDAVRQEAIERGELLPVWKDGRVVLVWPAAPERSHAVSIGLLVRGLIERGVGLSNTDIEVMASFPIGDVELVLSSDNLRVAEWLTSIPPVGMVQDRLFFGIRAPDNPGFDRPAWLDVANRAVWNLDAGTITTDWSSAKIKSVSNVPPTPPVPAKARA
jgi:hypothetical protein